MFLIQLLSEVTIISYNPQTTLLIDEILGIWLADVVCTIPSLLDDFVVSNDNASELCKPKRLEYFAEIESHLQVLKGINDLRTKMENEKKRHGDGKQYELLSEDAERNKIYIRRF